MLGGTSLRRSMAAASSTNHRLTFVLQSNRSLSSFVRRPQCNTQGLSKQKPLLASSNMPKTFVPSIPSLSSIRFNSSSSPAPIAHAAAPENSLDVPLPGGASDITELSPLDIEKIPEGIGYLKELGLDFGWGPSSIMEWMIEHIHIWSGLPWWASIVGAGLLIRLVLLKPIITSSDIGAKMRQLKPKIDPVRQRILQSARAGNPIEAQKARAELRDLNKAHGLSPWKSLVPLIQIPFGFGCFRVVRGMSALPVPALAQEHFWWITDLTVADPLYILPAVTSAVLYFSLKKGGESGMTILTDSSVGRGLLYGLPIMSFCFMSFWPSSLQLYFVATGLFGLAQAYFINSPAIRRLLDLTPLPNSSSGSAPGAEPPRLRLIEEAEKSREQPQPVSGTRELPADLSLLDRWKASIMKPFKNMSQEMKDSVNKWTGEGSGQKGSDVPARLSKADLQRAEQYERTRRDEEALKRAERNERLLQEAQRRKNMKKQQRQQKPKTPN